MAEYIEREAALQFVFDACAECLDACEEFDGINPDCQQCMLEGVKLKLRDIPTTDVAPVRHGRWYKFMMVHIDPQTGIGIGQDMYKCSVCNVGEEETRKPYCPECGAKMDGADKTDAEAQE